MADEPLTKADAARPETGAPRPTEPVESAQPPAAGHTGQDRPFGRPGRPLSRSAFITGFTGGLGLLLAYSAFLAIRNASSVLVLIFIALFLAVGLNPAAVRLQKWGLPRGAAVAIVGLGTVLLFCGGLFALVPPLINQSTDFAQQLPNYLEDLKRNQTLNDLNTRYDIIDRARSAVNPGTLALAVGGVLGGAKLVFGTIFNVLTVFVLMIYFMGAFERLKRGAYRMVPATRRQRVELLTEEILAKVGAYIAGALAIAVLAGGSTYVFLIIAGVAYPFALAVVVAICDLIPQIGATLGAVVVAIAGFATSLPVGIACVVFFVVYQQVENYLIYPTVMRRSVKVSDLAAIIAALLGVALLGVIGALIAIPAVAAIQLVIREVIIPRQEQH